MADESFRKTYYAHEFLALTNGSLAENKDIIDAAIATIDPPLSVPVNETRLALGGGALIVEWAALPTPADVAAVDAAIAAVEGGETTSQPFEFNSFEVSTTQSGTHVAKIDETTPPLEPGTYQVLWSSSLRMQAVIANTGVEGRIVLTRSDGVSVTQSDSWDLANVHAFNGGITFVVQAGQTLHVELTFARLGASGTAEMSGARVTVDQLSAATA